MYVFSQEQQLIFNLTNLHKITAKKAEMNMIQASSPLKYNIR